MQRFTIADTPPRGPLDAVAAAPAAAKEEPKKAAKKKTTTEEGDMGFGLFD